MDWETSFEAYLEHLCEALGHNDRESGLKGYCQGLGMVFKTGEGPHVQQVGCRGQ